MVPKDFQENNNKNEFTWKWKLAIFNELGKAEVSPKATSRNSPKSDYPNSQLFCDVNGERYNPVSNYTCHRWSRIRALFDREKQILKNLLRK